MTATFPRPARPLGALRRIALLLAPRGRARTPLDDAVADEVQSLRHGADLVRLRDIRLNRHLARDMGLEAEPDSHRPVVGPGGRLF
ncbi:hypothetical protein [Limimaricola pyoseonensis]|uniref:Uncharacterized protein n=1 Tax=Limimaricola pyoseonensis TaxID=521013 RepID=A0A1G7H1E0_9RHOB|nr:hypothetical protein [Limimaricola pyoseonensis]SDE94246.1 hypothetical protein SAMN04488567_3033 [Limimaricola pyoseonensis]